MCSPFPSVRKWKIGLFLEILLSRWILPKGRRRSSAIVWRKN